MTKARRRWLRSCRGSARAVGTPADFVPDDAAGRVPGEIGTGLWLTMSAWVGEATWVERRIRFVDVRRQVAKVREENCRSFSKDEIERWRDIEPESCFRYVSWIGRARP